MCQNNLSPTPTQTETRGGETSIVISWFGDDESRLPAVQNTAVDPSDPSAGFLPMESLRPMESLSGHDFLL